MAEGLNNELEGIPAPSGSYEVGCTHLMHQDLQIRLYYPTDRDLATTLQRATYYPHSNYLKAWLEIFSVSLSSLEPEELSLLESQKIPALLNAPLIQNITPDYPKGFPVVVYSHGLTSHFLHSSGICSDLASHGYVVAAVEHRDSSATLALNRVPGPKVQEGQYDEYVDEWIPFNMIISITHPDRRTFNYPFRNQQIKQRAKEMGQALDILRLLNEGGDVRDMLGGQFDFTQFKGRLNVELAAVCGHSFGGGTVIQTLSEDPRFRCGIALDAWTFPLSEDIYISGIQQPLTLINSANYQTAKDIENMMKLLKPPSDTGLATHTLYTIKETSHASQTDIPFALTPKLPMQFIDSSLDKYVAHKVNMDICHAFLKRFLLQDPILSGHVPILDGGEGASEYVIHGTNIEWEK